MDKATVVLGLSGIVILVWAFGILIGLWANPIFGFFMVASNSVADILSYFGLGIGALLLLSAVIIYYQNTNERANKIYRFSSQKRLTRNVEFYDDYWRKNFSQETNSDNLDDQQFAIANGRRVNLGSEVMEKIVD